MTAEEMTALAPGNTKPGAALRARAFQFTLNEVDKYESLKNDLLALKTCDYLISCEEVAPTTGHKHIHIYVHFNQTYRISKKIMKHKAHIEICKGSPKQNIAYIEKDGNILDEIGERPSQGIKTVKELKESSINEVAPQLYNIKRRIDEEEKSKNCFLDMLTEIENDTLKAPKIYYYTGPSGSGKTYSAYKRALSMYKKEEIGRLTLNNNFVCVENEAAKCFVIEEFRSSQIRAADFLQLIDKYGYKCNTKGGFMLLRPECIIICSIIHPEDLYRDEEINTQFTRRITEVINLGHDEDKNKLVLDEDV